MKQEQVYGKPAADVRLLEVLAVAGCIGGRTMRLYKSQAKAPVYRAWLVQTYYFDKTVGRPPVGYCRLIIPVESARTYGIQLGKEKKNVSLSKVSAKHRRPNTE